MSDELDLSLYTRAPQIDLPSGYALGIALLSAVPKEIPSGAPARAAARRLRSALMTLSEAWRAREKLGPVDRRPFDAVADAAWRALNFRLEAAAQLSGSPELDEISAEARTLIGQLFTSGLAFITLPYPSQWAHADRLLQTIDKDGLARRIDHIAGEPYLAFVRRAHEAYGAALRITAAASEDEVEVGGGVREPLRRVQAAIQEYVFAVLATLPPSKKSNVAILRRALAPIDAHRAAQAKSRASGKSASPELPEDPNAPQEPAGPAPTDPIPPVD